MVKDSNGVYRGHIYVNNLKKTNHWMVTKGWQNRRYCPSIAKPKPYKELNEVMKLIESYYS
jgi:endonuclease YncB( thermonuclease family)